MTDGREGTIEAGIRSKQVTGGCVRLTIGGGMASDLLRLSTNEFLTLLHALSRSRYTEITTGQRGFPYTFPIVFGE